MMSTEKSKNAFFQENGGILVGVQHGSFYGVISALSASHCIEYESDYFFTWGWSKYHNFGDRKYVPLPTPELLAPKYLSRNKRNTEILFIDKMYNLRSARLFRSAAAPSVDQLLSRYHRIH